MQGHPGSSCPRGYLASNTELSEAADLHRVARVPARQARTRSASRSPPPADTTDRARPRRLRQDLHLPPPRQRRARRARHRRSPGLPVAVCPGPNLAWFDREYTLREMVDHIYGRGESLVPASRPHCLAKELEMFVDHFAKQVEALTDDDTRGTRESRRSRRISNAGSSITAHSSASRLSRARTSRRSQTRSTSQRGALTRPGTRRVNRRPHPTPRAPSA